VKPYSEAAAFCTDGLGGFFPAMQNADAEFFAMRNDSGAMISVTMSDSAISQPSERWSGDS
jgi:hypothetical protein